MVRACVYYASESFEHVSHGIHAPFHASASPCLADEDDEEEEDDEDDEEDEEAEEDEEDAPQLLEDEEEEEEGVRLRMLCAVCKK